MELSEYLKKHNKYPILFVGSGISRRYMSTPDWRELIKKAFQLIGYTDVDFVAKINNLKQKEIKDNEILLHLAEEMIQEYEAKYKELDDINEFTKNVASIVTQNEKKSRFKELICQIINKYEKEEDNSEIKAFRKINSKIYTFITTNYDNFLNDIITDRENIIGNNVILKEPLKSIYKIHGCMSDSDSIVIGVSDYNKFKENNILLFS
ncbi:MAG: SIR2 family protein [Mycoplasmatales bacterium]